MAEKDFLVTSVGAELPDFERPTYVIARPSKKLLESKAIKSAIEKFAPLVHASNPQIKFAEINLEELKQGKNELTCMDAREFSNSSREYLRGENFVTFAASGFFAHPEIAEKLRSNGHGDIADALMEILNMLKGEDIPIGVLSNHFGKDGGCGGLGFIKDSCGGLEIPDAEAYRKLLQETREAIGEIAQGAKLVMYQTGTDGKIVASFDLEDDKEFAEFEKNYQREF